MLGNTIMKKKQLAMAVSTALCLSFSSLPVLAVTVEGGAGIEITYDETGVDSKVSLVADLLMLDSVSITYLPLNIVAILTPELLALIPTEAMAGLRAEQIEKLSPEAVAGLTPEQAKQIRPTAMSGFNAEQISQLSLEVVAVLSADQIARLSQDAIGGLSVEQFNQLTVAALSGLTALNMGGISAEVIEVLGLNLLLKLNIETFKRMSVGDVLWFMLNLDVNLVRPEHVVAFLPAGWSIHPVSGKLKIPKGKLKLKKFKRKAMILPVGFDMPMFLNLRTSLALGGQAAGEPTILEDIQTLLEQKGYRNFNVSLSDSGVIRVSGLGVEFNFVADTEEVEQVEEDSEPKLELNEEGNYILITSSGLKLTLLTAPRDPVALVNLIPGGQVKMDKKGNIKMTIPGLGRTIVGTFDPVVLTAPPGAVPGVRLIGTRGDDEEAQIVYADGTMQILRPSVTDVLETTWSAAFYGTGKIKFKANGHIYYVNELNMPWNVVPSFDIQLNYSAPPLYPYYTWLVPGHTMLYVDTSGAAQLFYWHALNNMVNDDD
jgi:hypothetical protein